MLLQESLSNQPSQAVLNEVRVCLSVELIFHQATTAKTLRMALLPARCHHDVAGAVDCARGG